MHNCCLLCAMCFHPKTLQLKEKLKVIAELELMKSHKAKQAHALGKILGCNALILVLAA